MPRTRALVASLLSALSVAGCSCDPCKGDDDEMMKAAAVGDGARVKALLQRGVSPRLACGGSRWGVSALALAVASGERDAVEPFLVDQPQRDLALHAALTHPGDDALPAWLVAGGARLDPRPSCDYVRAALAHAVPKAREARLGLLLRLGADQDGRCRGAALGAVVHQIARGRSGTGAGVGPELLELVLSTGPAPDVADPQTGRTPLMIAAAEAQPDLVRRLLSAGADPKRRDKAGDTACALAAKAGHPELAPVLGGCGAP